VSAFAELPELGLRTSEGKPAILLHRDIKPGNILFKNGKIKIADLGLAEAVDVTKMNDQTHEKEAGTICWMSPQILRRLRYSTKTDIFSLGVVLYEMLHKTLPWGNLVSSFLLDKILSKTPDYKQDLQSGTIDLLSGMLRPNEEDRYDWKRVAQHKIFDKVRKAREDERKRIEHEQYVKEKYVYIHPTGAFRILKPRAIKAY